MEMVVWFLLYVVLILALASWRDHHDGARSTRSRGIGGPSALGRSARRRVTVRAVRSPLRHPRRAP